MSRHYRVAGVTALVAGAIAVSACTSATPSASVAAATPIEDAVEPPTPHGDHTPHFGGLVFMHGELHFEVVLDRAGAHRVYFSNATREDLPAATASSVTITVSRTGEPDEVVAARVDESGESWIGRGAPLDQEASARVDIVTATGPYWIDIPYSPSGS